MLNSRRARFGFVGATGVAALLLLFGLLRADATPIQTVAPASPTATERSAPAVVQAVAERVTTSFDGIVRMDRKEVVQLGDVSRADGPGIAGATDGSWAIVVVGDIRQTMGVMAVPNSQCAIWFVNSLGQIFATQRGPITRCDPYLAAR